ncbi:MAG: prepilin peptidase [Candidatus Adlerbacteria bacterium]|nr:prepilin peptidase [Candidatus Adlerbacteria bacterium]
MYLFLLASFVLGIVLGSFINALVFRFNTGRGMGGRSRCMHCGHTLSALDLIPVLSFLFLRGQCRYCGTRISLQYPLVELTAGALALLVYLTYWPDLVASGYWLVVWMTLLFIVVYDIRHGIIPWSVSGFLILLSLFYLFFFTEPTLWNILAGPLLALPLFLFSLVSRGTWMGWGDSALELSLGWLLGLTMGATALVLAFWSGAAVGIALLTLKRGYKMKSELPFAPFLVLGALATHFFYVDFFATLPLLFL